MDFTGYYSKWWRFRLYGSNSLHGCGIDFICLEHLEKPLIENICHYEPEESAQVTQWWTVFYLSIEHLTDSFELLK